jgi:hypothetical protein
MTIILYIHPCRKEISMAKTYVIKKYTTNTLATLLLMGAISFTLTMAQRVYAAETGAGDDRGERGEKFLYLAPKIGDFVLYAERSVHLGESDNLLGGEIGVHSFAEPKFGVQMKVGANSKIERSHDLFSPSITLGHGVDLGILQTDVLTDDGIALHNPDPFKISAMPPLPLVPVTAPGGANVTVDARQIVNLAPGDYGALVVAGALRLSPGAYSFTSVTLRDFAMLTADSGDVGVTIRDGLTTGREAHIGTTERGGSARLLLAIAGSDGDKSQAAVSIGEHSTVHAVIVAANGTLSFADNVEATGAFAGFDIDIGNNVKLNYERGLPEQDKETHGQQRLSGYVKTPSSPSINPLVGPAPQSTMVHLTIGLPARDAAGLKQLADQVSDPKNPKYRQYLTTSQFAQTYGQTPANYQAVVQWAKAAGLTIDTTFSSNLFVSVTGTAAQIERALYTNLQLRMRRDGSTFITVGREPSLDLAVPLLQISGLNDSVPPRPKLETQGPARPSPNDPGSGPGGAFGGNDFRSAYASGITETGTGQTVALFQFDGFFASDIKAYRTLFGLANVPVTTQLLNGFNGLPSRDGTGALSAGGANNAEVSLDIEMAMAMAPGLDAIVVYEGTQANSILAAIAAPPAGVPLSRQVSTSWDYSVDDNTRQILLQFAVQGQSFFDASGDSGAFSSDPGDDRDQPYVTLVGGTVLSMNGNGASWSSETTWSGSSGGILTNVSIPSYQFPINMSANGGSLQFRNAPDVAMIANGVQIVANNGFQLTANGTSIAAPLWAAYIALVNQRAQVASKPVVGFPNPTLYTIGQAAARYAADFHDINDNSSNGGFNAVAGYDLATGWGTPNSALVYDLSGVPLAPPPASATATITYHQVGGCNGYVTTSGGVNTGHFSGPNAAFVIFGIESIKNDQPAKSFAFDPANLFVHQGVDSSFDSHLSLYADILKASAAGSASVMPNQDLKFANGAFGALVVQTVLADGATEADKTPYTLRYKAQAGDPTVNLVKSDAARTSWPLTQDCTTITLQ